jgi:YggT family protein
MLVIGYFLLATAKILGIVIVMYKIIIVASALVSWVNADPYNPIVRFLFQVTEPVYQRIRPYMPRVLSRTRFDFSPLIVFLLLVFIEEFFVKLLWIQAHKFLAP